jgi:3-oxoadipate enol-lactonase
MQVLSRPWGQMHYQSQGAADLPCVVFANSLGTDLRLWDALLPLLPAGFRFLRYDKRGHGLSDVAPLNDVSDLAEDAMTLIEAEARGPVIFVGLSIGGLIGQCLAAKRPELIRGLVISNSAARLGTAESWQSRIDAINTGGLASIADAVMQRWFGPDFLAKPELALWRNMLLSTPEQGYIQTCRALGTADQTEATRQLRLPTLLISGSADGACPPEVTRATADLIAGSQFHLLPDLGHLPCVENPAAFAATLTPFLEAHR